MDEKGQNRDQKQAHKEQSSDSFVLEKSVFSNVFEKDIRRVYIYKKAERLARAIHLIAPAFKHSTALRKRADEIAIALVDSAVLPPLEARAALSRELLSLSSLLSIARTGGFLSPMNADLVSREAHLLLEEVASYEEPRLFLEHAPSLAELAKSTQRKPIPARAPAAKKAPPLPAISIGHSKGLVSDMPARESGRKDTILSVLRSKGPSYIKDISTIVRDVSEKTIQRELQALVGEGRVRKEGNRRWTRYSLAS